MRTFKIGRKRYAIGLWWQVYNAAKPSRNAALKEARRQAESILENAYDSVVLRSSQYGLGKSENGKSVRAISLACALTKKSEASWIGLFKLDEAEDLWWVCAASQRLIAGDGDFYGTEAQARSRFKDLEGLTRWPNTIVCDSAAESTSYIEALLDGGEKVRPLAGESLLRRVLLPALVLLVVVALWQAWQAYQAAQEAERSMRAAQLAAKNKKEPGQTEQHFQKQWQLKPLPSVPCREFMDHVSRQPLYSQGWRLEAIELGQSGFTVTWVFQPGASFAVRPQGTVLDSANAEVAKAFFPVEFSKRQPRPLAAQAEVRVALFELTRLTGAKLTFGWTGPETKSISRGVGLSPLVISSPWTQGSWKLESLPEAILNSTDFSEALDAIPGLALDRITYDQTITMEGLVYALR